jgi:tetratricopeptide (TPR) repeat protein
MNTQQFDKALDLINELNETIGKSEKRELYKAEILQDAKYQGPEKNNLLDQIRKNPKEESNYIALIYMYSQSNQEEKAMEIAKKLETEIPTSDWAQVSLFKFHINTNDGDKAVKSMNTVLASSKIDRKIKHRIFNEFLIFSKNNPKYDVDLDKAISYFADDREVKVAKELGKFYATKKEWNSAIKYYEMHLKSSNDDYETAILLLQALTEIAAFDKLVETSDQWMQLFPSQPQFFYYSGLGYNQLQNYKKAKNDLELGLDNVVDDITLEINLTIQLGEAYNGLGDAKKKDFYFSKANELLKKTKQ